MSNSPICTVNGSSTTNGVDVTASSTVTIALADTAGVRQWNLECTSTDSLNVAATVTSGLVIDLVTKTATFTAPATLGSALIFSSKINGGVDLNGVQQESYTATFKVSVLTATFLRVPAFAEQMENNAQFGWNPIIEDLIRNYTGSTASAGLGLVFSGGAYNIVSADDSIVVNADNIQFRSSFRALLLGATSAVTPSTLCLRDSQGSINLSGPNGSAKYEGSIIITAPSGFNIIQTGQSTDVATNNLTIQTQGAFASATGSNRKPGDLNLAINAPSNSGTTDGFVNIKIASVTQIALGRNNTTSSGLINFPGSGELTTSGGGSLSLNTSTIKYGISGSTTSIQPANNTTNGATGDQTIFSAMACTGTTSTGGALSLRSGNGTTVAGDVTIINGVSTNTTFSSTSVTFTMQTVQFTANQTNCIFKQADNTTNSATAATLTVRAANATGTTSTGGDLIVASGTGTTANGSVKINSGSTTRIQANGTGLGFFNATPIAKPTVTGAKGGNAALASLLTQLVSLGLITDSSTA